MAKIDITPPNRIYGTFSRLNYKPWYAIAEFVDNSTQNFFTNSQRIADAEGSALLDIEISYSTSTNELRIIDNANGMNIEELTRALKLSTPPPDTSGRSEFGMGLKTAACWFGKVWTVRTSRLGDSNEYIVEFDVEKIGSDDDNNHIEVSVKTVEANSHYTELTIFELHSPLVGRQIQKIKSMLSSMYRSDIEKGTVDIRWNGDQLTYNSPELYEMEREDGEKYVLREYLDFYVTDPTNPDKEVIHHVTGWFGVLKTMSQSLNGFALLRRGRLILGLPNEGWRPHELMGQVGSLEWKRLVGELHVDSFPVAITKDNFPWDGGLEENLIEMLIPLCNGYKAIARDLRTRVSTTPLEPEDFKPAMAALQTSVSEPAFKSEAARLNVPLPVGTKRDDVNTDDAKQVPTFIEVPLPSGNIRANLYLKDLEPSLPWIKVSAPYNTEIDVVLNTRHPFVEACVVDERGRFILGQLVMGLAIAEQQGRLTHGDMVPADEIRMWMSTILARSRDS